MIDQRLDSITNARQIGDLQSLLDLVRSGLVRNLGNITAGKLYNRAFAGTKYNIESYMIQIAGAVRDISHRIGTPSFDRATHGAALSTQSRLDFLHDSRQAFGRTTLVLQGGAVFGLCHMGIVKALFFQGLLPRIITGTGTGALIASLVAIHNEEKLAEVLERGAIDLSAFEQREQKASMQDGWGLPSSLKIAMRKVKRFWRQGYFLDVEVMEQCVKDNVGDLTFEEAYNRSKRVLNITIATEKQGGMPTLLNYITTPNVVSLL
jgi:TAG lipase / lysophosphatidylethanolamine acyltransferase